MDINGFRFSEKYLSQIPALQQLINLGFEYLPPDQALALKERKKRERPVPTRVGSVEGPNNSGRKTLDADLLRWLSRPKPRWIQSRWAVNAMRSLVSAGFFNKSRGNCFLLELRNSRYMSFPRKRESRRGDLMSRTQQHIVGFFPAENVASSSLMALANQGALDWIPAFAGMTATTGMTTTTAMAILYSTHPPRLSGFDREAQPWRVFCACWVGSGQYA